MRDDWIHKLQLEDLPDDLQGLAHRIGVRATLEVWRHWQGSDIYIPSLRGRLWRRMRDRAVRRRWDELARKGEPHIDARVAEEFGVTVRHARRIAGRDDRQAGLFPDSTDK